MKKKRTKKEEARHIWIEDTMMFQRIAKTGEDTYEELGAFYDENYGRKSTKIQKAIADNAMTNRVILEMGNDG